MVVGDQGIWLLDSSNQKVRDFCNLPLQVSGSPDIPVKTKDGTIIGNI